MRQVHVFLIFGSALLPLAADQITLKNGDRLTGKIITADDKILTLKTAYAGEVKIDRAVVTAIQTDEVLNVTLKDQGDVLAKVDSGAEAAKLLKPDGAVVTVEPAAVSSLRDDASQKAWVREQERVNHPRLNDFWSGFISFGLANASGNSKSSTISTAASATRIAGKNKMGLNFAQIYATQSTTAPFGTTASRISGSFRIDRDLSPKLFVYGINAYDYDRFLDLDLRTALGGGLGWHTWKNPRGFLDLAGGGNWNREKFSTSTGPLVRNSAEAHIGQEFGYELFKKLKLSERLGFLPNLSQTGEYRLNFDSTASVPILKWLEWNVGFNSRYLSNPLPGKRKNDTILTMGVRVSFDQTKR
jgi:putative salt-induced outer membrane protein YdiY